jgi:hypothetical protein
MVFIGIESLLNEMQLLAALDSENWGILTADYADFTDEGKVDNHSASAVSAKSAVYF